MKEINFSDADFLTISWSSILRISFLADTKDNETNVNAFIRS